MFYCSDEMLKFKQKALITFVYVNILIVIFQGLCLCEDCEKLSDCSFSCDGEIFDISGVGNSDGQPAFKDILGSDGYAYSYNPCFPFTESDPTGYPDECQNVVSCQVITDFGAKQFYDCGLLSSVTYQMLAGREISNLIKSDDVMMVASYSSSNLGRSTKVILGCGDTNSIQMLGEDPSTPTEYIYVLQTPSACGAGGGGGGISIGSILIIVVFVLIIVYMVGGTAFMRFGRGASGVEMIPNRTVWSDVPALIRDGMLFVTRICRRDKSYENL